MKEEGMTIVKNQNNRGNTKLNNEEHLKKEKIIQPTQKQYKKQKKIL